MATIRVFMAADAVYFSGRWPERNRIMGPVNGCWRRFLFRSLARAESCNGHNPVAMSAGDVPFPDLDG
jgi:hypothetical protein